MTDKQKMAASPTTEMPDKAEGVLDAALEQIQEEARQHTLQQQVIMQQLSGDIEATFERIQQSMTQREHAQNTVTQELLESISKRFVLQEEATNLSRDSCHQNCQCRTFMPWEW